MKNKYLQNLVLTGSIVLFVFASLLYAGTTGKISGVLKDKQTGEPMPGASIQIVGTQMGAATNLKGEYFIINVPPGKYTVKATLIGYAPMEVQNVDVSVDLTTSLDFSLSPEALEMKGVTVVAERPLLIKDQTASVRVMEAEELKNMPTRGYQEAVSLQSGIATYSDNPGTRLRGDRENTNNPRLNIRGGRASEVAYYVDGFSQQDYLTGVATTSINQNAIQEITVTTGGFNAEYGKIMSGAINVVTKEGGSKYSGNLEAVTDNLFNSESNKYDYNLYDVSFSGPLIPGNDKTSFFISGERRWQGDRSPSGIGGGILKYNSLGGWTWQGKFGFRLSSALDLKLGTLGSIDDWREYRHDYLYDADHMPRYLDKNYSYYGKITHTVNSSLFYTLSANFFSTERKRGDGVHFDNLDEYGRPDGNFDYDDEALFWSWDDPDTPVERDSAGYIIIVRDTEKNIIAADEGHVWDDYLHRKSSYYGLDFDLTHQVNQYNQIKAGFEFQRHTLKYYRHLWPILVSDGLGGGGYLDAVNYGFDQLGEESDTSYSGLDEAKHPLTFALYLQEKLEWRGLVVNAGIRYDFLDPKTKRLKDETNPLDSETSQLTEDRLEDSKAYHQVSPRLGVGFPVTDRTVLHFSYGKFFQQPDLENLYVSYRFLEYKVQTGGYYFAFGNPNLKPEQTTAYEVGVSHQLGRNVKIDLTAYYKDVKDLTEVVNQPVEVGRNFASFRNADFGTVKGLEFGLTMRRTNYISLNLSYTLSYANGTGSFTNSHRNIAWTAGAKTVPPKMVAPLDFDQRHKLSAMVDLRAREGEGVQFGELRPFENAGVNFVLNVGSGKAYTPTVMANEITLGNYAPRPAGPINSHHGPWTMRLDLKANKIFYVGRLELDFYLWVLNVFDKKNAIDVYEVSGLPDNVGWLASAEGQQFIQDHAEVDDDTGLSGEEKYKLRQEDPSNFDIPRMIRFGLRIGF